MPDGQPRKLGPATAEPALVFGAPPARPRFRHWLAAFGFLVMVVCPTLLAAAYLAFTAADRFGSRVAFSIRSNQASAPLEILGAVTQLGNSSVLTDGQVLYDYIRSQQIVETVRARLPLDAYYNRAPRDWVFSLGEGQPVEELIDCWNRMVDVSLDPATGILAVEARAFSPVEARAIATEILAASADLVDRLADTAREDAVRHAATELAASEVQLRDIRTRLRLFRDIEQEVDPSQNAKVAIELVASLEEELSQTRVKLDLLRRALDDSAPGIVMLKRRVESLEARIAAERTRLGSGQAGGGQRALSEVVGEFEELVVDREFAEQAYTLALATYQQAEAEARRRHRYLAAHIEPTLSEEAEYPDRPLLVLAVFLLALAGWSIIVLASWNLRDRS
ncbi:MAG TPA: capsule biosynthesis protein [Thermohalobaculum sp.]|nr:capsule biosynthesis protein [Thermohalobaculum sp.]